MYLPLTKVEATAVSDCHVMSTTQPCPPPLPSNECQGERALACPLCEEYIYLLFLLSPSLPSMTDGTQTTHRLAVCYFLFSSTTAHPARVCSAFGWRPLHCCPLLCSFIRLFSLHFFVNCTLLTALYQQFNPFSHQVLHKKDREGQRRLTALAGHSSKMSFEVRHRNRPSCSRSAPIKNNMLVD